MRARFGYTGCSIQMVPLTKNGAPRDATVHASMALLCLIWGSTYLVIREGLRDLPPFTSAAIRFVAAFLLFSLLAPRLSRREGGERPGAWLVLSMGTLNVGVPYGLVYWSETILPSGLVSVLWATFPLMMALVGHIFLPGERLRARQWTGFLVGFLGVAYLFATDLRALGPEAVPAGALLLLSPAVYAVGSAVVKRHGARTSSVLLNRGGMAVGAGWLLAAALLLERGAEPRWSAAAIGSIAYLTIVGTVVAFGVYYWLLRYAPAYKLALIAYVIPVIALSLGALARSEPVGLETAIGTAGVLAGVALVFSKGEPAREEARAGVQGP